MHKDDDLVIGRFHDKFIIDACDFRYLQSMHIRWSRIDLVWIPDTFNMLCKFYSQFCSFLLSNQLY